MKLKIEIDIELVEDFGDDKDVIARVFYPDEGNKIQIKKGLNLIEVHRAIHHEVGHLMDWYISEGKQSEDVGIRERNADIIGSEILCDNQVKTPGGKQNGKERI